MADINVKLLQGTEAKMAGDQAPAIKDGQLYFATIDEGTKGYIYLDSNGKRFSFGKYAETAGYATEAGAAENATKAVTATSAKNGVYYIEGDSSSTAGHWIGNNTDITEYYNGLTIAYKIPIEGGSSKTYLKINTLPEVEVVKNATTVVRTTEYPVKSIVILTYTKDGSTAYWKIADYNTNTDTKIRQYVTSTDNSYPLLFTYKTRDDVPTSSYEANYGRFNSSVYINPSLGKINATEFEGALKGTADKATEFAEATTVSLTGDAKGTSQASTRGWTVPVEVLQAAKLKTARKIDGISFNGEADINRYAVCSTTGDTVAKTASILSGTFNLAEGARVTVKFTYANTVANPTLNINSTGAKQIYAGGSALSEGQWWKSGAVIDFVYNGEFWVLTSGAGSGGGAYWANVQTSHLSNENTKPTFNPEFKVYLPSNTVIPGTAGMAYASPIGKYLWHDLFAFGTSGYPTVTTSSNGGSSWTTSTNTDYTHKPFIKKENQSITVLKDGQTAIRWQWFNNQFHACQAKFLNIGFTYQSPIGTFTITFETSKDGATWTKGFEKTGCQYNQTPYWFYLTSSWSSEPYVRLTFTRTSSTGSVGISGIKLLTSRWGDQGKGSEYENPYDWDISQNIFPRNNNSSTLGTTGLKWKEVHATTFYGNLSGNASSADQAQTAGKANEFTTAATIKLQGDATGETSSVKGWTIDVDVNQATHADEADKWTTAQNFTITDGTNVGDVSTVDGSSSVSLKLPSIIEATLHGSATEFSQDTTVKLTGDVTGSATSKRGWEIATTVKDDSHNHQQLTGWTDGNSANRNTPTTPNEYNLKFWPRGIKTKTAIGDTDGSTYTSIIGFRGWGDSSGGDAYELGFTQQGNIYTRHGATDTWGAWDRIPTVGTNNAFTGTNTFNGNIIAGGDVTLNGDGKTFTSHIDSKFVKQIQGNISALHSSTTASFNTTDKPAGYHLISITPTTSWMLAFTVRLYQNYHYTDIVISGYNYSSAQTWHVPKAKIIGSTSTSSVEVVFGCSAANKLWVAIPAHSYYGIDIFNVTNGYNQITDYTNLFTITRVLTLPTSTPKSAVTITAQPPWYRGETITTANGGTGNTAFTANRLLYSESQTKLSSSGHYSSANKVAINSNAEPTEAFYVNGTAKISTDLGVGGSLTVDQVSTLKGNTTIGDAATDTLTVNATATFTTLATIPNILLNRQAGASSGRISFYKKGFYTWYEYMSNPIAGASPTTGMPATYGDVTSWARRSLIENQTGYGWIWEATTNSKAATTETKPTAIMALSSVSGKLTLKGALYQNDGANKVLDTADIAGTANKIAKFTAANTIGDSNINDNGTEITLDKPLYIKGGDSASVGKIALDQTQSGQITNQAQQTLFGFTTNNATALTIGHTNYSIVLRGDTTKNPTYNTYVIPHTKNTTGTIGSVSKPVYINAGIISEVTGIETSVGGTGSTSYTANRMIRSNDTANALISTNHYANNTQFAINSTNENNELANLNFYVSGNSKVSGELTATGNVYFNNLITQGSPSNDSSIASMNRFATDVFISGNGTAPNAPTVPGFYLGKSAADDNRHIDIVSGKDFSYIDFNNASIAEDYRVRLIANVVNGLTSMKWAETATDKRFSIEGALNVTSGATITGDASITNLLTVGYGATHRGIKVGHAYINALDNNLIFQNHGAIRFGTDAWDYNEWAGLKYTHNDKSIYLGLADNSIFKANAGQTGGKLLLPGVEAIYFGNSTLNESIIDISNVGTWVAACNGSSFINSKKAAGAFSPMLSGATTNGRMTVAFYNTALQATYITKANCDSNNNQVGKTATLFDESGNASWPGSVTVSTNLTVKGNTTLGDTAASDTLTVNAKSTLNNTLTVSTGGAQITGASKIDGALEVTGATTIGNNLTVTGNTVLGDSATDSATIYGSLSKLSGHIYLDGAADSSASNTTQIIFRKGSTEHYAISSNDDCFVVNPTSGSTANQIALYLGDRAGTTSKLPSKLQAPGFIGPLTGNVTGNADTATKATQDADGNTISSTYLKKSGGTMTGQLLTSFKSSVAIGSYASSANTVEGLVQEIRYSSGAMGSISIGTAYTNGSNTIATGWYNFVYTPHRTGGLNGAASGDNHQYGTLMLYGMTINDAHWRIRVASGSIAEVARIIESDTAYATLGYVKKTGDIMSGNLVVSKSSGSPAITAERSDTGAKVSLMAGSSGTNRGVYDSVLDKWIVYSDGTDARTQLKLYGAVWNDYAEFRKAETIEPGRIVVEHESGEMKLSSERLQAGANVTSDTFGFAIGETDECKTPIAVAGRALVYTYEDRNSYPLGAAVCAAPGGTVSLMTREEIREWPDRIIGTVSEIPKYETWGEDNVAINGRIWIKVR